MRITDGQNPPVNRQFTYAVFHAAARTCLCGSAVTESHLRLAAEANSGADMLCATVTKVHVASIVATVIQGQPCQIYRSCGSSIRPLVTLERQTCFQRTQPAPAAKTVCIRRRFQVMTGALSHHICPQAAGGMHRRSDNRPLLYTSSRVTPGTGAVIVFISTEESSRCTIHTGFQREELLQQVAAQLYKAVAAAFPVSHPRAIPAVIFMPHMTTSDVRPQTCCYL